jgi:hypothetical protein
MTVRVTKRAYAAQKSLVAQFWAAYSAAHEVVMGHEMACAIRQTTGQALPAAPFGLCFTAQHKEYSLHKYEHESKKLDKMRVY